MENPQEQIKNLPKNFIGSPGSGNTTIAVPEQLDIAIHGLDAILLYARKKRASDVHLTPDTHIVFRQFGSLKPQTEKKLKFNRIKEIIENAISPELFNQFLKEGDLEFVHTIEGGGRFRVTMIKQRQGWDLTARVIPNSVIPFEKSGMPASCRELTKWTQGLILITGPAGCGKSTTLNTLVDMINQDRSDHIITIEQPIEFVYGAKKCQVSQREIGQHTLSQNNALRAALREDPDIIVVSELRGVENIHLAVTAAETGHLVFGTMNTINATQTIINLINSFPPEDETIISNMLAESLRGIICQQMIPKKDGTGVVLAFEVLIMNSAIANMIRSGKSPQITNAIATGKSSGMVLLDHSLRQLQMSGMITEEEVRKRSSFGMGF